MKKEARQTRAKDHTEWVDRCLARNLPDEASRNAKTKYGDPYGPVYSLPVCFTGLTPDGTKATFELENGGVAIVPYPKYLRHTTE